MTPRRCRLFCFPHAGGNGSAFHAWAAHPALAAVTLQPVDYPGRQARFGEPALARMEDLVALLLAELGPRFEPPFAFFGHSMGALVAFELTRTLRRRGLPAPRQLIVSGASTPRLRRGGLPLHQLPDALLLARLGLAGVHPAPLLALMLPTLRADVALCETYRPADEPALNVPLAAFAGSRDPSVSWGELSAWRLQTRAAFVARQFPGDHHYLVPSQAGLCEALGRLLAGPSPQRTATPSIHPETVDEHTAAR